MIVVLKGMERAYVVGLTRADNNVELEEREGRSVVIHHGSGCLDPNGRAMILHSFIQIVVNVSADHQLLTLIIINVLIIISFMNVRYNR